MFEFEVDLCETLPGCEFGGSGVDGSFCAFEGEVVASFGHAELGLHIEEGGVEGEDLDGVVEEGDSFDFFVGVDEDASEKGGDFGVFRAKLFEEVDAGGEAAGGVDVGEEAGGEVVGDEGGDLDLGVGAELVAWR